MLKALLKAPLTSNQPTNRRGHSMKNIPLLIEKQNVNLGKTSYSAVLENAGVNDIVLISVGRGG